jgi:ABC-2 type transport system ATP-binding protein
VAGHDVMTQAARGARPDRALGQHAAVDEELGGRQNLEMFGRLYHLGAAGARAGRRAAGAFGLADAADKPAGSTAAACGAGSTSPRR